jgi:hypothetical protein
MDTNTVMNYLDKKTPHIPFIIQLDDGRLCTKKTQAFEEDEDEEEGKKRADISTEK